MIKISKSRLKRHVIIIILLLVNFSIDQSSKNMVRNNIEDYQSINVIDGILTLTKVENTGAFLSLGNSLTGTWSFVLLQLLPLLSLVFGIGFLIVKKDLSSSFVVGLSLIIGGGIGNIYDRIIYGSVTDFLHIDFGIVQTGVFNVADMTIMTGMGLLLLDSYKNRKS